MNALITSAPLLLRRRGALADALPVIAFTAATAIIATVIGGAAAFARRIPADLTGPVSAEAQLMPFLMLCALFASVLLIPSAVGLGGSAARLSLARRERDLAAIRLVGGTTAQVGGIAVLDVAAQALLGAAAGVVVHMLAAAPLTALDFGITPFTVGELLMPWWAYPLLIAAVVLLAAASAAVSLTGVVLSPLGVARDSRTVRMSVLRLLIWGALIIGFLLFMQIMPMIDSQGSNLGMVIAIGFVAAIVAGMNVAGPFLVWVAARIAAALAPAPALLVGARRLAADPRAGWRAVSGITFAMVIAGFLTIIATIEPSTPEDQMLVTALHTGGMLTLGIAAVLAAVVTGVTQTARVIDHAPQIRAQHIAGAEVSQLYRARLAEITLPVLLSSVVATFTAFLVLLIVFGGGAADARTVILYFLGVLGAYALVVAAVLVSAPLVRRAALRTA
ncbi:FtsX-like permease family protein [Brachybacterium muris]|uniref:Permease n=1 Tax=Brachybacterium muris UCD-AY4 TaxID=1249481 RepID=A0A022L113_9MICO|nr:FtsX-like permease family protein [Brachybacterium muris]EYT50931.1 permease [Brachybacterium muris UCD-AY4]